MCAASSGPLLACDQGSAFSAPAHGPHLRIIEASPSPGAGLDCDETDPQCGISPAAVLRFRFNRHLDPNTAVRQSLRFYAGADYQVFLEPSYDVLERVVTLRPSGRLLPGLVYSVELGRAGAPDDYGFRAYDGALLAEGAVPFGYSVRVRTHGVDVPAPAETAPNCRVALEILQSSCGLADCHAECEGGSCSHQPRMGLRLDSVEGILGTAIERVAHQTLKGQDSTTPLEDPARFGAQMPIIDPQRPFNSYLIYKLLIASDNYRTQSGYACDSVFSGDPPRQVCHMPAREELERLRNWWVVGESMPAGGYPLDRDDPFTALRTLERWVAHGARMEECD